VLLAFWGPRSHSSGIARPVVIFHQYDISAIEVPAAQVIRVDAKLKVGSINEKTGLAHGDVLRYSRGSRMVGGGQPNMPWSECGRLRYQYERLVLGPCAGTASSSRNGGLIPNDDMGQQG
jgi:hypothetical protein